MMLYNAFTKKLIVAGMANFKINIPIGYSASGHMDLPMSLALDKELTFKTVFRYRHIYPMAIEAVANWSSCQRIFR